MIQSSKETRAEWLVCSGTKHLPCDRCDLFICWCPRGGWKSEEDDRKGKGCMLQFQHAMVRVLTHFVAEQADPREPQAFFLGSDWQVDVTRLVRYFMKVEDPRVARLQAGRVLSGRDLGTTNVQVIKSTTYWNVNGLSCPWTQQNASSQIR